MDALARVHARLRLKKAADGGDGDGGGDASGGSGAATPKKEVPSEPWPEVSADFVVDPPPATDSGYLSRVTLSRVPPTVSALKSELEAAFGNALVSGVFHGARPLKDDRAWQLAARSFASKAGARETAELGKRVKGLRDDLSSASLHQESAAVTNALHSALELAQRKELHPLLRDSGIIPWAVAAMKLPRAPFTTHRNAAWLVATLAASEDNLEALEECSVVEALHECFFLRRVPRLSAPNAAMLSESLANALGCLTSTERGRRIVMGAVRPVQARKSKMRSSTRASLAASARTPTKPDDGSDDGRGGSGSGSGGGGGGGGDDEHYVPMLNLGTHLLVVLLQARFPPVRHSALQVLTRLAAHSPQQLAYALAHEVEDTAASSAALRNADGAASASPTDSSPGRARSAAGRRAAAAAAAALAVTGWRGADEPLAPLQQLVHENNRFADNELLYVAVLCTHFAEMPDGDGVPLLGTRGVVEMLGRMWRVLQGEEGGASVLSRTESDARLLRVARKAEDDALAKATGKVVTAESKAKAAAADKARMEEEARQAEVERRLAARAAKAAGNVTVGNRGGGDGGGSSAVKGFLSQSNPSVSFADLLALKARAGPGGVDPQLPIDQDELRDLVARHVTAAMWFAEHAHAEVQRQELAAATAAEARLDGSDAGGQPARAAAAKAKPGSSMAAYGGVQGLRDKLAVLVSLVQSDDLLVLRCGLGVIANMASQPVLAIRLVEEGVAFEMVARVNQRAVDARLKEVAAAALVGLASVDTPGMRESLWRDGAGEFFVSMCRESFEGLTTPEVARQIALERKKSHAFRVMGASSAGDASTRQDSVEVLLSRLSPAKGHYPATVYNSLVGLARITGTSGKRRKRGAVEVLVHLLAFADLPMIRVTCIAAWCLMHNVEHRTAFGDNGGVAILVAWLDLLMAVYGEALQLGLEDPCDALDAIDAAEAAAAADRGARKAQRRRERAQAGDEGSDTESGSGSAASFQYKDITGRRSGLRGARMEGQVAVARLSPKDIMLLRKRREVLDGLASKSKALPSGAFAELCEAIAGALWLALFDDRNVGRFIQCTSLEPMLRTLHALNVGARVASAGAGGRYGRKFGMMHKAHHMVIGCMWTLSQGSVIRGELLMTDIAAELLKASHAAGRDKRVPAKFKLFAAGFAADLQRDSDKDKKKRDRAKAKRLNERAALGGGSPGSVHSGGGKPSDDDGNSGVDEDEYLLERSMVSLVRSDDPVAVAYGVQMIASEVHSPGGKRAVAAMNGVAQLLLLLRRTLAPEWAPGDDMTLFDDYAGVASGVRRGPVAAEPQVYPGQAHQMVVSFAPTVPASASDTGEAGEANANDAGDGADGHLKLGLRVRLMHALLNLSTEPAACVAIGRGRGRGGSRNGVGVGIGSLLVTAFAMRGDPAERAFCSRISQNLARRGENRSQLYKAALACRAVTWRKAVMDKNRRDHDEAAVRHERATVPVTVGEVEYALSVRGRFESWMTEALGHRQWHRATLPDGTIRELEATQVRAITMAVLGEPYTPAAASPHSQGTGAVSAREGAAEAKGAESGTAYKSPSDTARASRGRTRDMAASPFRPSLSSRNAQDGASTDAAATMSGSESGFAFDTYVDDGEDSGYDDDALYAWGAPGRATADSSGEYGDDDSGYDSEEAFAARLEEAKRMADGTEDRHRGRAASVDLSVVSIDTEGETLLRKVEARRAKQTEIDDERAERRRQQELAAQEAPQLEAEAAERAARLTAAGFETGRTPAELTKLLVDVPVDDSASSDGAASHELSDEEPWHVRLNKSPKKRFAPGDLTGKPKVPLKKLLLRGRGLFSELEREEKVEADSKRRWDALVHGKGGGAEEGMPPDIRKMLEEGIDVDDEGMSLLNDLGLAEYKLAGDAKPPVEAQRPPSSPEPKKDVASAKVEHLSRSQQRRLSHVSLVQEAAADAANASRAHAAGLARNDSAATADTMFGDAHASGVSPLGMTGLSPSEARIGVLSPMSAKYSGRRRGSNTFVPQGVDAEAITAAAVAAEAEADSASSPLASSVASPMASVISTPTGTPSNFGVSVTVSAGGRGITASDFDSVMKAHASATVGGRRRRQSPATRARKRDRALTPMAGHQVQGPSSGDVAVAHAAAEFLNDAAASPDRPATPPARDSRALAPGDGHAPPYNYRIPAAARPSTASGMRSPGDVPTALRGGRLASPTTSNSQRPSTANSSPATTARRRRPGSGGSGSASQPQRHPPRTPVRTGATKHAWGSPATTTRPSSAGSRRSRGSSGGGSRRKTPVHGGGSGGGASRTPQRRPQSARSRAPSTGSRGAGRSSPASGLGASRSTTHADGTFDEHGALTNTGKPHSKASSFTGFTKKVDAAGLQKTLASAIYAPVAAGVSADRTHESGQDIAKAHGLLLASPLRGEQHVDVTATLYEQPLEGFEGSGFSKGVVARKSRSAASDASDAEEKDGVDPDQDLVKEVTTLTASTSFGWDPAIASYVTTEQRQAAEAAKRTAEARTTRTRLGGSRAVSMASSVGGASVDSRRSALSGTGLFGAGGADAGDAMRLEAIRRRRMDVVRPLTVVLAPHGPRHRITFYERPKWMLEEDSASSTSSGEDSDGGAIAKKRRKDRRLKARRIKDNADLARANRPYKQPKPTPAQVAAKLMAEAEAKAVADAAGEEGSLAVAVAAAAAAGPVGKTATPTDRERRGSLSEEAGRGGRRKSVMEDPALAGGGRRRRVSLVDAQGGLRGARSLEAAQAGDGSDTRQMARTWRAKEAARARQAEEAARVRKNRVSSALNRLKGLTGTGVKELTVRSPVVVTRDEARRRRRLADVTPPAPTGMAEAPRFPTVHMCRFPHKEGARACAGLFKHYTLPSGDVVHYHHDDDLFELVANTGMQAPSAPVHFRDIYITTLPEGIPIGPPEDGDKPEPFVPATPQAPHPLEHVLPVADHVCTVDKPGGCDMMGVLPDVGRMKFQVAIEPRPVEVEREESSEEDDEDAWTLDVSVFAGRKREAMSRDYFDNERLERRAFKVDWGRVIEKRAVQDIIKKYGNDDEISQTQAVLRKHYRLLSDAFDYYSARGTGGDTSSMSYLAYTEFLSDCHITDESSAYCRRQHCEIIFKVVNKEEDSRSAEGQANADREFMRFELLEAVVRLGIAKFLQSGDTDDVSDSIEMLCLRCIVPYLEPKQELYDSDVFRRERLYREEIDKIFRPYVPLLRLIHQKLSKPKNAVKKGRRMNLKEWTKMLADANMFSDDFTRQESTLAFSYSKMGVVDELKQQGLWTTLSFIDFLEAIGRIAEMITLPTHKEVKKSGAADCWEFFQRVQEKKIAPLERRDSGDWDMPKTRPLAGKLTMCLQLLCGRLDKSGKGNLTVDQVKAWPG